MKLQSPDIRINSVIPLLVLFLFITSACEPDQGIIQPMPTQVASQVPKMSSPTRIPSPTTAVLSETPFSDPTPFTIPSQTSLPTIPPTEIPSYIHDLILNDVDCSLPCWLGVKPNKTTWDEARHFLGSFSDQFGNGYIESNKGDISKYTVIKYSFLYKISGEDYGGSTFSVQGDMVKNIEVDPTGMEAYYPLPRLLLTLGPPEAIYISTFSDYGSHGQLEFNIYIMYDEIKASYRFEGEKIGETIRACVSSQLIGPGLELGEPMVEYQTPSGFGIPLEIATGVSIETFTTVFQNKNNKECLETPTNLWP